jgi:hypothetical protein
MVENTRENGKTISSMEEVRRYGITDQRSMRAIL